MYRPCKFWGTQVDWGNPIRGREGIVHACMHACVCACVYVLVTLCVRVCVHCVVFLVSLMIFSVCFVKKRTIWQERPFLYNCVCMCSWQSIGPACVEGVKISYM